MRSISAITPNGVSHVNTVRWSTGGLLAAVDLKDIRRQRLAKLAKMRNVVDNPSGLGLLIGKKPNQVYNLLSGKASFGEKVARSIEASAGLPVMWLDVDEEAGASLPGWPFKNVDLDRVLALSTEVRWMVEGGLIQILNGLEKPTPKPAETSVTQPSRYSDPREAKKVRQRAALPPMKDGDNEGIGSNRRAPRRKGR